MANQILYLGDGVACNHLMNSNIFQDGSLINQVVGIKTHNVSVPLDYLLSKRHIPLTMLLKSFTHLDIEPLIYDIKKWPPTTKVNLKDFDFIRCIGHGGFSQVYLVRNRSNGEYFAMKLIQKKQILQQGKQTIIQTERDIMAQLEHTLIVKMQYAFESRRYLVFVLEYCSGGELFYLLRKVKRMSEEEAFFYFAEICLGMKHLHDNRIVYRDIKPENILIDCEGHIRIADFGLSKPQMGPDDIAFSFCGSPEYMAPEMLLKAGHSFQLDLYCLGALLYELITGLPPFYSRDTDEIYHRIVNSKLTFPSSVSISPQLRDLLSSLLIKNPKKRIADITSILEHPWMQQWGGMQLFQKIELKQITPPFMPDPFRFNFDEEEFGQGETEFLNEIRTIQDQQAENFPRDCLIVDNIFNPKHGILNKPQQEGTGGTENLYKTENLLPSQSSERSKLQTKANKQQSQRMNTLDDFMEPKIQTQEVPKHKHNPRLQTETEQVQKRNWQFK